MTTFTTKTIDGVPAVDNSTWQDVLDEAAKYHRSRITIEDLSKIEISEAQRKWLHCEAGPIRELMRAGWSFREAKEHVKVEYGRRWFVVDLTPENFGKTEGVFRWECRKSFCRKIIHPMDVVLEYDANDSSECIIRGCPYCQFEGLKPIAIRSIMDLSVKKINLWFDEIFAHFPNVLPPDPEWKKKKDK